MVPGLLTYLWVGSKLCKSKIDEGADNDEEIEAIPRIGEIVFETVRSEFEHELADKEECEEQIYVVQKVSVPLRLIIHLWTNDENWFVALIPHLHSQGDCVEDNSKEDSILA